MKLQRIALIAGVAVALVAGSVLAADAVKSGPQVGQKVPGPFHPLNVTGPNAGEKVCLFCKNGENPVAMIFAREVDTALTTLVKKIDVATAKNSEANMGSFVVFLGETGELEAKLKDVAQKENLKSIVLSIDNPAGPKGYKVAKDADITVVLYTNRTVKANYAFKKGELDEKGIEKIVSDISKIIPEK